MFGDFICGNYEKPKLSDGLNSSNQQFGLSSINQFDLGSNHNHGLSTGPLLSDMDQKFFSDWEDIMICYSIAKTLF